MKKKRWLYLFFALFFICMGVFKYLSDDLQNQMPIDIASSGMYDYYTVTNVGKTPSKYGGAVLKKELLSKAVRTSDGYLLFDNGIKKYNLKGRLIWKQTYPFISENNDGASVSIVPAQDDSFVLCYAIAAYQDSATAWHYGTPVLARCDKTGDLIWQKSYANFSDTVLGKAFFLKNGNLITIGRTQKNGTNQAGISTDDDLYLSLINSKGKLLAEKYYGGTDQEVLYDAAYVENIGLIAAINTCSGTDTFSSVSEDFIGDVLLLIDENLKIKWQKPFGSLISEDCMQVTNEGVYLLDYQSKYSKVDFRGNTVFEKQLYSEDKVSSFIGISKYGCAIQCDDDITFYENDTVQLTVKLRAGLAEKVIDMDNGFIIVSENNTGTLPSSSDYSCLLNSSQLIYSGYDKKGKLLWRKTHDNTPEVYRTISPCWEYPLRTN